MMKFEFFFFSITSIFLITYLLIRVSHRLNLVDIPNDRSSHKNKIPKIGGLAMLIALMISLIYLYDSILGIAFIKGLFIVSIIFGILGLLDDIFSLPFLLRLAIQFLAGLLVAASINFEQFAGVYSGVFLSFVAAVFYFAWTINAYNFMDGIDGIATLQAIFYFFTVGLFSAILGYPEISFFMFLFLSFCLGFLFWNIPSPKSFLGNSGSYLLGSVIAFSSIKFIELDLGLFWISLMAMSIFHADTVITLLIRIFNKRKIFSAHKEHLYHLMTQYFDSHIKVSIIYGLANLLFIFPAICFYLFYDLGVYFIFSSIAFFLTLIYFLFRKIVFHN